MDAPKRPCRTYPEIPNFNLVFSFYHEIYTYAHVGKDGKAFFCEGDGKRKEEESVPTGDLACSSS